MHTFGTLSLLIPGPLSCEVFGCEKGCGHEVGHDLPAYVVAPDLFTFRKCLAGEYSLPTCEAANVKTRPRLFTRFGKKKP